MKLLLLCCVLLIFVQSGNVECKRGGGSRGGGSRGKSSSGSGWSLFSRKSGKESHGSPSAPAPAPAPPKSSGVHEPSIKKDTSHAQHSTNHQQQQQQPSYGWNVPAGANQNTGGFKSGYVAPPAYSPHANQQNSYQGFNNHQQRVAPPAYPGVAPPAYPGHQQGHAYQQHGYQTHGAPPAYPGHSNQYGGFQQNHGYQSHGYNPSGGYSGYHPNTGYTGMGGYGGQRGFGGNYPGYGGGYGGFGGSHGYGGGFGGYGGMGGFGGYGMQKKSGFFSGGTFRNILTGMLVYHMTSSLIGGIFGSHKRPYNVYNYYNLPPEAKEEIKMPANILTLCEGNATNACIKGTTAICTNNGTVLCVTTMSQATPCAEENALCINATVPCEDKNDPMCKNNTQQQNEAVVNMPCFTNLSVDVNLLNETGANGPNENYKYCVTAMAVAGPEYKKCEDSSNAQEDFRSVLAGKYNWSLTVHPLKRPYTIHNFEHPTETPTGEVVMPLDVIVPCLENATKLCLPGLVSICTTFNEIMCIELASVAKYCDQFNTTCLSRELRCDDTHTLCQNKTEEELIVKDDQSMISYDIPCFANITINTNLPNFDIYSFNGTIPEGTNTSYTYHYHYCVATLGLPGPDNEACLVEDAKS